VTAPDPPGLSDIIAWAQFLGIDITDAVQKARKLMQTDPAAVQAGGERLTTVAGGLETSHQDIGRVGTDLLAGGMNGQTADAFKTSHAELVEKSAGMSGSAKQLSAELGQIATAFKNGQQTVITSTGATSTALRMLKA